MTESTLQERIEHCPPALQTIIEEFRDAPPRDRMEYLIEYAMSLPPLPARYQAQRDGITPQRVRGLHALLGYMKKQVKNRL